MSSMDKYLVEYHNEYTKVIDQCLIHKCNFGTYMLNDPTKVNDMEAYPIRFPGATRGAIYVRNGIVVGVAFYQALCKGLYTDAVYDCLNDFIEKPFCIGAPDPIN